VNGEMGLKITIEGSEVEIESVVLKILKNVFSEVDENLKKHGVDITETITREEIENGLKIRKE
jgi:hypothetical protein